MELDKEFRRKRCVSFIIVLGFLFFGGCEYVIILPTVWDYLESLGAKEEYWLGFTLSVYSFSAAFAGIIGGRLADIYMQHSKSIVIASLAFRAIGNFQYLLGINVYNVLCARLLCGLGAAAGTALMAEVCRTTRVDERTTFLSICNATFQFGILVGPALQLILSSFNFSIFGYFTVTPLNAPGLFLGILWLVYWLLTMCFYENLTDEFRKHERRLLAKQSGLECSVQSSYKRVSVEEVDGATYRQYLDEFLTDTYILLLSVVFVLFFSQIAIETIIPVISEDFGYGVYENTFIYMGGGLEALIVYFAVAFIGRCVRETTLLIVGLSLILLGQIALLLILPHVRSGDSTHMMYFLLAILINYLGNPIAAVSSTALASKVLSNETQGLGQGIRRLVAYIGLIFGPTWAGSTVNYPYLFLGATIIIIVVNAIMLGFSFTHLRRAEDHILELAEKQINGGFDESTPLLKKQRSI